jgi:hypothetical protein
MRTKHLIELKKLNIIKHLLIQEDENSLSVFLNSITFGEVYSKYYYEFYNEIGKNKR